MRCSAISDLCKLGWPALFQVFFGSLTGQLIVMDVHGAMVSNVTLLEGTSVLEMGWNCEKFKMEERDEASVCAGKSELLGPLKMEPRRNS